MEWICAKCQEYNKSWLNKNCKHCKHPFGVALPETPPTPEKKAEPKDPARWEMDHQQMLLGLQAVWENLILLREELQELSMLIEPREQEAPGVPLESPTTDEVAEPAVEQAQVPLVPEKKRIGRPPKVKA